MLQSLPKGGACSKYGLPGCLHLQRNEMNRDKGDLDVNRFGSFAPKTSILSSASRHCMTVHHFSCGPSVPGLLLVMAPGAVGVRPHGYPRLSGCRGRCEEATCTKWIPFLPSPVKYTCTYTVNYCVYIKMN